ncbi:WD40-repeat-containing domain protein [Mucidula mucida]|nr:WD40-repeat-containing domain protein [Mucidula mucida]
MIPASWKRYHLSQLINKALSLSIPVPFDFLVKQEVLTTTLGEWCAENDVSEETLEIEYIESILPPQKMSDLPHEEWVSSVSCELQGIFLTASYDGSVRAFDYSRKELIAAPLHSAPITSFCVVSSDADAESHVIATASHDLTAQLTRLNITGNQSLSQACICTSDLCIWDTTVPSTDEVPEESFDGERKKRRKLDASADKPKRKAPIGVLKSHSGRVSRVLFGQGNAAHSCGFDSTIRTWDVENEICTSTIRCGYWRPSLMHAATPSCLATAPSSPNQLVSGAYDGIVRMWDVRSTKMAMASFKAWEGKKKILSVDWHRGLVGVGGEGGLEVWKAAEDASS